MSDGSASMTAVPLPSGIRPMPPILISKAEADIILEDRRPMTVRDARRQRHRRRDGDPGRRAAATLGAVRRPGVCAAYRQDPFMRMVREFPSMAVSIMQELAQRLTIRTNS